MGAQPQRVMKVVLDTNVFVSRFLSPKGTPARIIGLLEDGAFQILVSEVLIGEYNRALQYEHVRRVHGLTSVQVRKWVNGLRR
ncbi:MAG TPA: putative toxin-antitoxin system toxin component, PIN family, partial [Chloroflexia bacterium]